MNEQSAAHDWRDYEQAVRAYLADCELAADEMKAASSSLDPKYHPTEDGAVKMIPHGGNPAEAAKIRQAFRTALMPQLEAAADRSELELEI
jgi:hypothetical protein